MPYAAPRHRSPRREGVKQHEARESPHARGYDRRWRRLRRMHLMKHPLCADPFEVHGRWGVPGTHVDHIVPLSRGGSNHESNL